MLDVRPMLMVSNFPAVTRGTLETLQVNLGYKCNLSCTHCHVAAGPTRTEMMMEAVIADVLEFISVKKIKVLDLTGGAPEMNPHFRSLVTEARRMGVKVMDRCNLTIMHEDGQADLGAFLAEQGVEIVASLPCYAEQNVDKQRGKGVYQESIAALKQLNGLGYGREGSGLTLNLVYNPGGPFLPSAQEKLEADYKRELLDHHGIEFNQLFVLANMPISRFGSVLLSKGQFNDYMQLLHDSYSEHNLHSVMCRTLISVDWQGYVYDCDFNQMLDIPLIASDKPKVHLRDLMTENLEGSAIATADHCYGCTAGQGSSCGGALD
ncbi:radical SAM/Cys-rich domain protein [Hahella sp. KA22]|uniref:arsenosugar biosynthesis radical SAM (seleno)protein ArsS n=1 Tax=Hahella sp. KA22 TaxID=1628392 RepID=UPI000FDEAF48|nr:arsenosugar biosynthesis radical SAM (seleno)protein ArsS [Hahella sp. KA22]AZZ91268.1 radical SAM/Cys-rich domain protein [Hahella sp. KA22]QAY54637.1 radical SAM/Cys-rich domain protein [Hahella sp. KA22]